MVTGEEYPKGKMVGKHKKLTWLQALYNISGRTFVYVMLYFIFALFLLGLLPHFSAFPI